MDAIENRKMLSPNVEAVNESEADRNSIEAKTDHDSQVAKSELENETERQHQQRVLDAGLTANAGSTANTGSEWDPWKLMILRRA